MATWREAKQQAAGYFFDGETMSYFDSRLNGNPKEYEDGSFFGVVSSKPPKGERRYEVVRITPEGHTTRAHPADEPFRGDRQFQYDNRNDALYAVDALVDGDENPEDYIWF